MRQVGNEPDGEPVYVQPAGMDKLIELASTLVSGAVIAVVAAWLTNRSRNRQEQQAEIGALRAQADAMTVAVMELQGTAVANRLLWEGTAERGRTFLLTLLAFAGGAARARIADGTDAQSGLVGFGRAAELLSRERVASKQIVAAVREPLTRAGTAAAPLMRYSDPAVVTATSSCSVLWPPWRTPRVWRPPWGRSAGPSTRSPHCGCPGGHVGEPSRRDEGHPQCGPAAGCGPAVRSAPRFPPQDQQRYGAAAHLVGDTLQEVVVDTVSTAPTPFPQVSADGREPSVHTAWVLRM